MTPRDFCYWLQGYFELSGKDLKELNDEQIGIISSHLQMVFAYNTDPKGEGTDFCYIMLGYLQINRKRKFDVKYIQSELNKCFKHEIDPIYGDESMQNQLNDIHPVQHIVDGKLQDTLMRC